MCIHANIGMWLYERGQPSGRVLWESLMLFIQYFWLAVVLGTWYDALSGSLVILWVVRSNMCYYFWAETSNCQLKTPLNTLPSTRLLSVFRMAAPSSAWIPAWGARSGAPSKPQWTPGRREMSRCHEPLSSVGFFIQHNLVYSESNGLVVGQHIAGGTLRLLQYFFKYWKALLTTGKKLGTIRMAEIVPKTCWTKFWQILSETALTPSFCAW